MTECHLLTDLPASGSWNMAVDQMLLAWCQQSGQSCLRFYRWQQPTLSLGYFQAYGDRQHHRASLACPVVRRSSGGGAIVHDTELTYSFVVPQTDRLARNRLSFYESVHRTLLEALAEWNVRGSLFDAKQSATSKESPFLCFLRRSPGDVLLGSTKIAGSAQRRNSGAVLQHGSVLLKRSDAAPELDGISELTGQSIDFDALAEVWLDRLSHHFDFTFREMQLSTTQLMQTETLQQQQYGCSDWIVHRQSPLKRM